MCLLMWKTYCSLTPWVAGRGVNGGPRFWNTCPRRGHTAESMPRAKHEAGYLLLVSGMRLSLCPSAPKESWGAMVGRVEDSGKVRNTGAQIALPGPAARVPESWGHLGPIYNIREIKVALGCAYECNYLGMI